MSKGKKGTIPVPDGQVGTCHPARNEWNLKKTALERKGVGDSRDLLIVEITIPDFLLKKKKAEALSSLLFLKRTIKALYPKQLIYSASWESHTLGITPWLLFEEANEVNQAKLQTPGLH